MPISPISSCAPYPQDLQDRFRQGNKDLQDLAKALNSGDLAGAQRAFEALKQDIRNIQHMKSGHPAPPPYPDLRPIDSTQASVNRDTGIGTHIDVIV